MNLYNKTGKMALGSRLRLLTSRITEDAVRIYELYDADFSPKWFPVFFALWENGETTITAIADEIGHSQPSVTTIIKEMAVAGLVENGIKSNDKRKNIAGLTEKGRALANRMINVQCKDVDMAIDGMIAETTHNLWEAIAEWEFLLDKKSLFKRVEQQKKIRESLEVEIVAYEPQYAAAFKSLNEEWISTYFEMEEADHRTLDHPQEYILDKGGKIFVALYNNEAVGACALIKLNDNEYDFEMAKMAVSPGAQGKSIGSLLGNAVINAALQMGAKNVYLESNTLLKPAINLYHKLGFKKIAGKSTPYKRCDIQMVLDLGKKNK
ncbi:GNAT family N-acetyltransferase [Mucilaginibacter sp. AW1-7]|uniref:bifunctional helix-turn-helix transcriptional regulator/GNAT family N-acetyltransferase n=1 Tax=Mucilaginibacter sp. AW1-7 TaxID=3349874 RepID=UPI003F739773